MATETKLTELVINQLTQQQYDDLVSAGNVNPNELYFTPSDITNLANQIEQLQTALNSLNLGFASTEADM